MSALDPQPHAVLERSSRERKAKKIEQLLSPYCSIAGSNILEVGAGSGYISHYLARTAGDTGSVMAVDVIDQRQQTDGYSFQLVTDTQLPFDDRSFDLVVSNHVIEHVGDRAAQLRHLIEIRRVLDTDGCLYLAVPNRWTLVEPHFRLPFLSWLPRSLRSAYVRLAARGEVYDCDPPSYREMVALFKGAGFRPRDLSIEGISALGQIEASSSLLRFLLTRSRYWAPPARPILPSFLFVAMPLAEKALAGTSPR